MNSAAGLCQHLIPSLWFRVNYSMCRELEKRLKIAESEASVYASKLGELHNALKSATKDALEARQREKILRSQVILRI